MNSRYRSSTPNGVPECQGFVVVVRLFVCFVIRSFQISQLSKMRTGRIGTLPHVWCPDKKVACDWNTGVHGHGKPRPHPCRTWAMVSFQTRDL